jgi:hypothetical protein
MRSMVVKVGPEIEQLVFEICCCPEQNVIQILPSGVPSLDDDHPQAHLTKRTKPTNAQPMAQQAGSNHEQE